MPISFERRSAEAAARDDHVAVIDIGSNSMRLVVYDGPTRSPVPLHNEKIMCGLGRGVEKAGRLNPEGIALALDNLVRFRWLLEGMGVGRVDIVATAAVRDAADGGDFVRAVAERAGLDVRIVTGPEEARLSALGVLSGTPGADGLMGDLGGGSLELVGLEKGEIGPRQVTLPIGPLRLAELSGGRPDRAVPVIERHLGEQEWIRDYRGRDFHPVGGSWRALAKLHMEQVAHPLHIIHHYTVDGPALRDFVGVLARQSRSSIEKMRRVSKRRADTLPYAALAMEYLLRTVAPARVVFSAHGLREGVLFDLLDEDERRKDPLITACTEIARRLGRFGAGDVLTGWTAPLFPGEDEGAVRLRHAACLLSDLGWSEHPDYRAEHAFLRVLRMPFAGIDHAGRAWLALACYVRYAGRTDGSATARMRSLIGESGVARANILGLALRLAHTLTGGVTGLLQRTSLRLDAEELLLLLPEEDRIMVGDAVQRRLDALARMVNRRGRIDVSRPAGA